MFPPKSTRAAAQLRVVGYAAMGTLVLLALAQIVAVLLVVRPVHSPAALAGIAIHVRTFVIVETVIFLAFGAALYALLIRPAQNGLDHALTDEARQRERLRSIALLATAQARDARAQIDRSLAFAQAALPCETACIGFVREDTVVDGYGTVASEVRPLVQAFAQQCFGNRGVFTNDEKSLGRSSRGQSWIATTVFVNERPEGILVLTARGMRDFDAADRDFVLVLGALSGAAMERERRERALRDMAYVDALTGLPNRAYLLNHVRDLVEDKKRRRNVYVHYIDLDGFKPVNDSLGHAAGDDVLRAIAARMNATIGERDVLARIGGDEFVVVQAGVANDDAALDLGKRLVQAASEPIVLDGRTVALGASVGIASGLNDGDDAKTLMHNADAAMYAAKRAGRNRAVMHSEIVAAETAARASYR